MASRWKDAANGHVEEIDGIGIENELNEEIENEQNEEIENEQNEEIENEQNDEVSSLDLFKTGLRYSYCLSNSSLERPMLPMRSLSRLSIAWLCVPPLESRHSDGSG
jgi:hypothetical protein